MKVAISVAQFGLGCQLEPRFGRAERFLIVDLERGACQAWGNAPQAGAGSAAGVLTSKRLIEAGVNAVITGHVGPRARAVLQAAGVQIADGHTGTAQDALRAFEANCFRPTG